MNFFSHIDQLLWLLAESMILGAILYLLLRLRPWLGNAPLVLTVGSIQFLQVLLALSLYIEVFPGLYRHRLEALRRGASSGSAAR